MAAEAEAEGTNNEGHGNKSKDVAITGVGFQSAAALLRAHGSGHAEVSREGSILSPRFRSAAAMAGWDEEALLASLVVEDTPVRDESKHKKRPQARINSPPTTDSRRKRRSRRQSPPIPPVTLSLDDEETTGEAAPVADAKTMETEASPEHVGHKEEESGGKGPAAAAIPCMDRLREELSCAICLDICFEPSTTPCGHSFCKKCLKCAAAKCGKRCPKCRELIGNGRSCTVNTVLWNTIQLLFPEEIEARKKASPSSSRRRKPKISSPSRDSSNGSSAADSITRNPSIIRLNSIRSSVRAARLMEGDRAMRRTAVPSQSEDAALALRLQREEFMEAFGETQQPHRSTVYLARANLRAMASRAIRMHIGHRS